MGITRLGTSSWSAKGWAGTFYPRGLPAGEYLVHYAQQFDTVEADNSYYAVPSREWVRGWERKLPAGFSMAAKFPRAIVHAGDGPRPAAERVMQGAECLRARDAFLEVMSLMGAKLGPLLLQFPYFNRQAFPTAGAFVDRLEAFLDNLPRGPRYAVEVRNKTWIGPELLAALSSRGVALAWADHPYVPHPDQLQGSLDLQTADFTYTRLIGDRKATEAHTQTFDRLVLDKTQELERWAAFLRPGLATAKESFVYANNHYAGHGPATIRQLAAILRAPQGA